MDSDDELADYSEAPVPRPQPPPRTAHSKASSTTRHTPASSSSRAPAPSGKSKHTKRVPTPVAEEDEDGEESEVQEIVGDDDGDVEMDGGRVNGKGRARAQAGGRKGRGKDVVDEDEESERPAKRGASAPARPKAVAASAAPKRDNKVEADLRKRLEEITRSRDAYAEQFDALTELKSTEPELALASYKLAASDRARAQSALIAHLQTQISHLQELNRAGQVLPVSLLPQGGEAERRLEEERKGWEVERRGWEEREGEWRRREEVLRREVAAQEDLIIQLREDLSHSRPLSKSTDTYPAPSHNGGGKDTSLAPRIGVPPATPSHKQLSTGQTKNSLVVCLYEDLTNLLVTSCQYKPGRYGNDEVYVCVLTSGGHSLQFQLRCFRDLLTSPLPTTTATQKDISYVDQVVYTPLMLEQESPEWVEQLDFLGGQFTFRRDQMHVFLAQLTNHMPDLGEAKAEE